MDVYILRVVYIFVSHKVRDFLWIIMTFSITSDFNFCKASSYIIRKSHRSYKAHNDGMKYDSKVQYVWVIDQARGQDGWILAKFFFREFMDRDGEILLAGYSR